MQPRPSMSWPASSPPNRRMICPSRRCQRKDSWADHAHEGLTMAKKSSKRLAQRPAVARRTAAPRSAKLPEDRPAKRNRNDERMEIKRGIPVSPGVAIGPAMMLDTESFRIPQRVTDKAGVPDEVTRLHKALADSAAEARAIQKMVSDKLGPQVGDIIGAHANLIQDPNLCRQIESLIREHNFAAEYAVSTHIRGYAKKLESMNSGTFAARAADLYDIEKRILHNLLGQRAEQLHHLKAPVIVLAHDLTPSETATLDKQKVFAFATEAGGKTSHTAIMAGALEI